MLIFNNTLCIQSLLGDFLVVLWVSIFSSPGVMGMSCQSAAVKLQSRLLSFVIHRMKIGWFLQDARVR